MVFLILANFYSIFPGTAQPSGRQSLSLEFKRPQPQGTRVEAFTAEDFSDDMESLADE